MQSWIADAFTGNFNGMMSNFAQQMLSSGLGAISLALGSPLAGTGAVSTSTPFGGGTNSGISGNGINSATNYSQPASFSLYDPMGSVGGQGYHQSLGNSGTFAGWTSISNGSPNSAAHPLAYCTAGNC